MITKSLIEVFDDCLKKNCSFIYDYYQDPLPEREIDDYMNKMGIDNEDYKTLYKWKDGLNLNESNNFPKEYNILFHGNFISLRDTLEQYENNESESDGWLKSQIVLMDKLLGECLLLETEKDSVYNGFLFSYEPFGSYACEPTTRYDSIEKLIVTIIELYENKAIWYDKDSGFLEIDFKLQRKICASINTESKYWKK